MSTLDIAATRPAARVPIAVRAAQLLLLVPLGALVVFGSIYFSVIEPQRDPGAVDWLVGAWALALGLGNVAVGFTLSSGRPIFHGAALAIGLLSTGSVRRFVGSSNRPGDPG